MVTDESGPFTPDLSGAPTAFPAVFGLLVAVVVVVFAVAIVRGVSQSRANESSPLRSVDAMVVSRRTDVHRSSTSADAQITAGAMATSSSTSYVVTFEEPSGERRELRVSGADYGQLAEGDRGHLIHQGTRYKGFTRHGAESSTT